MNCMSNNSPCTKFKIRKIIPKDSFYIIYASRHDSTFMILSREKPNCLGSEVIKKHEYYPLSLEKIFPMDSLFGKPVLENLGISRYYITTDCYIERNEKTHQTIYRATNLCGLYLVK